ncbi:hypothetical protein BDD12DRAFT_413166 [Trichophaea hybrida]|nr:hypothetical protein BDD12DRAFT_413166 [Trichophaea hybrida]
MSPPRRAGQTWHKGKLLGQVGGVSREEYDAMSSPDIISSTLAPTLWTSTRNPPTPTNPAKRAKIDRRQTIDDLAKPDAPTVAKVTAKSRSRQASVDTETSTRSSKSKTKDQQLNDFIDEADSTGSNPRNYLSALFAGKNPEEAKKDAERKVRRVSPGKSWDDGTGRRKQKSYGSRSKKTYKSATTNTAATSDPKIDTPTDSISLDSSAFEDEKTKKKPSFLKDGTKPDGKKSQVKKPLQPKVNKPDKPNTEESSSDDDPFSFVKTTGAFIDPRKYKAPPPPPPATNTKSGFINPCKAYPLPINKRHYEELGIENKIAPATFKNPLEQYGMCTMDRTWIQIMVFIIYH